MDQVFNELVKLIKAILGNLPLATILAGAVFGLIGFLIQLAVRGEWPTGRLNEGAPRTTVDPAALAMAVFAAIAIGVWAAGTFGFDVSEIGGDCTSATTAANSAAGRTCFQALRDPLFLVALGYLAADIGPPALKTLTQFVANIMALFKGPAK